MLTSTNAAQYVALFESLSLVANTPHNPVRFANTVGLVIERVRPEEAMGMLSISLLWPASYTVPHIDADSLRWYCRSSVHTKPTIIRQEHFHVTDLGTQLKPLIRNWMENESLRKCSECGDVAEAK